MSKTFDDWLHREDYGDRCAWCIVLETAAAKIRALAAAEAGKEGEE